jgi:hypothetical protein
MTAGIKLTSGLTSIYYIPRTYQRTGICIAPDRPLFDDFDLDSMIINALAAYKAHICPQIYTLSESLYACIVLLQSSPFLLFLIFN